MAAGAGRPVSYDEAAVVSAALEQFWASGFKGSSVDMLVAGTGLNKHSLYQAFGGKAGLFLRALQCYLDKYSQQFLNIFERTQGYAALREYFDAVLAQSDPRGCLLANTAVELGEADAECGRLLTGYYDRMAQCFAKAIAEGQRDDSIRTDLDAHATALWLVRAVQGAAVGRRLGGQNKADAKSLLALLGNGIAASGRKKSKQ